MRKKDKPPGKAMVPGPRSRLPRASTVGGVEESMKYLAKQRDFIERFESLDDFVWRGEEIDQKRSKAVEHHLLVVRNAVARALWGEDIFIGVSVIDQLAFDFLRWERDADLVSSILGLIGSKRLHGSGFVLYPVHSFGVLGLGLFRFIRRGSADVTSMVLGESGVAVTAQTNSMDGTFLYLEDVRTRFDIRKRIPEDLVEHFVRSRSLTWITRNPLLAIRVRSFTGEYYENQFVYMLKLRLRTAMIMMLASLEQHEESDPYMTLGNTRRLNNFQTLDIRHYLTFETTPGRQKRMSARCVPMNASTVELAQLSDLNVQVDPGYWLSKRAANRLKVLEMTIGAVERGYLSDVVADTSETVRSRVYRKLVLSIDAFRRSYSSGFISSESIVALAIAFESLLTDSYAAGVGDRIREGVRLCLLGVRGTTRYQSAVANLYKRRSETLHQGVRVTFEDMQAAREAYVLCLQSIVSKLGRLPANSSAPIADLLGVKPVRFEVCPVCGQRMHKRKG